jgi:hypothetical protein
MPLCKLEDWKDYLNENVTAHLTKQESCMSIKQLFEDHISVTHVTSNTQSTQNIPSCQECIWDTTLIHSFKIRYSDMSAHTVNKSGDIHVSGYVTCHVPNVRSIHWTSGTW